MLKAKSKILLAIFAIIMLVSSYCFATVEPISEAPTTTGEDSSNTTEVPEDISSSWTNSDLYIFEDKVTISNVVDGNAFVMGSEVTISGEIGGDLFVIADKLNIDGGYIYSNVFALANEITVNGVVYDIYAACDELENIHIKKAHIIIIKIILIFFIFIIISLIIHNILFD